VSNSIKTKTVTEILTDIKIQIDDILCEFEGTYAYDINTETTSVLLAHAKAKSNITKYTDLLPKDVANVLNAVKVASQQIAGREKDLIHLVKTTNLKTDSQTMTVFKLAHMISNTYNIDHDETLFEIYLLGQMFKTYGSLSDLKNGHTIFDKNYIYKISDDITKEEFNIFTSQAMLDSINTNHSWKKISESYLSKKVNSDTKQIQKITLTSEHKITNVTEIINQVLNTISKYNIRSTEKVGVHYLKIIEVVDKKETPNPAHKSWLTKKQMCESMKEKSEKAMEIFLAMDIPPETITEITKTKKVEQKKLNEVVKDIDTLYLKQADRIKLMSCLSQFRNQKDILKRHGLTNKLNIIGYGDPGTGKTTMIQAVATYLSKDIYYVDLKDAKTNDDLQMMFDYVIKNVQNGGIIVLEDIDAMTDVVLERKDKFIRISDENRIDAVASLMQKGDKPITLDYFLNILQGTLTIDDSVFIVTTNYFDKLDRAFTRDGRFDVKIHLDNCDHFQIRAIFKDFIGRDLDSAVLARIPEYKFAPASIIYHLKSTMFNTENTDAQHMEPFLIV